MRPCRLTRLCSLKELVQQDLQDAVTRRCIPHINARCAILQCTWFRSAFVFVFSRAWSRAQLKHRSLCDTALNMPPFGSVPAGTRHDGQHRTGSGINLPASLPRYEGFASTLGGFARSPQVSRGLPSILRPTQELEEPLISEQQRESAFIESLQAPSLTDERTDTADGHAQQSFRPASLLARSLGTLNEVFSRQVGVHIIFAAIPCLSNSCNCAYVCVQKIGEAHAAEHGDAASASGALGGSPSAGEQHCF